MKPDERDLMTLVADVHGGPYKSKDLPAAPFIDALAEQIGMHPKRAIGIALKWANKGWWSYGITVRSGWLTPCGYIEATKAESD